MKDDRKIKFEIFPWHENFETGIPLIDEQHQQLVHILNQLAAHLANRSSPIILNEIFDELAHYADYHFKAEEMIWVAHFKDDEWYSRHELTHGSFINDVIALKSEENTKTLDDTIQDIVSFLSHWLAYHILDTDKRMAKVVNGLELGLTLEQAKIHANDEMAGSTKILIDTVLTMYDNLSSRTLDLMREQARRKQAEASLKQSEERWQFILENRSDNIWDWNLEQDGAMHSQNTALESDHLSHEILKTAQKSTIHKDDLAQVKLALKNHLEGKSEFFVSKHRIVDEEGRWDWMSVRGKVVSRNENGMALRMIGTNTNISERELAMVVYQNSSQAMFVTDRNENIIGVNPAFTAITGYSEHEVLGKNPSILKSGKHDALFYQHMWQTLEATGKWEGEIWNKTKNGTSFPELLSINSVRDVDGEVDHRVALFSDITEKKNDEELILIQTNYDSLTKLPNRRMLYDRLKQEINKAHRSHTLLAVLLIDLDHFKEINDVFGHECGDELLKQAAERITQQVREVDTISRFGADEFAVILTEIEDTISVGHRVQDIIDILTKPFTIADQQAYVSASVGITIYPNDADNVTELLKNADQAMSLAKQYGRSQFCYFTPSMQEEAQKRQGLIADLRQALDLEQFQIYYQPIINLQTLEIRKAEALLRWNHPDKGIVSPLDFIPLAEETGLIVRIGDWVFKEATTQTKMWQEMIDGDFQISINKSPIQFKTAMHTDEWLAHLKELELSGNGCVIEITESMLMDNNQKIIEQLLQFRDSGIEVAIDDFGTGYSSMSYLKKFDVDYLKIDQSFVRNLASDAQDLALCEAIVVMAHKLNIKVIAEGIETEVQRDILTAMGCDYGQGYLFSRPVPANDFIKLIRT